MQLATQFFLEVTYLFIMNPFNESGLQALPRWVVSIHTGLSLWLQLLLVLQSGVVVGVRCISGYKVCSIYLAGVLHLGKVVQLRWLVSLELLQLHQIDAAATACTEAFVESCQAL